MQAVATTPRDWIPWRRPCRKLCMWSTCTVQYILRSSIKYYCILLEPVLYIHSWKPPNSSAPFYESWMGYCTCGARGSGLPITVVRAVTPSMQVKTPCSDLWAMLGFAWRAPRRLADDLMTHHTAIILSYVCSSKHLQSKCSCLHSILPLLPYLPSTSCQGGLMGNLARIRRTTKLSIQSISLLQSLPLHRIFLQFLTVAPEHESKTE